MHRLWFVSIFCVLLSITVFGSSAYAQVSGIPDEAHWEKVDPRLFIEPDIAVQSGRYTADPDRVFQTFIHFAQKPDASEIAQLQDLGITVYEESWIPPLAHHPTGFMLADLPAPQLWDVAALSLVLRIASAE